MPSPLNLRARFAQAFPVRGDSMDLGGTQVREDAALPSSTSAGGGAISNFLSGLGTVRDSATSGRPNTSRAMLADAELVAMLRGTVYRRICGVYPEWATKKGVTINDSTDDPQPLDEQFRAHRVMSKLRQAGTWGRALGQGFVWMVVSDAAGSLADPLDPATVTKVHALHVLDRREVTVATWCDDPESPDWGQPETYYVTPIRPGIAAPGERIHASRLLAFDGHRLPPSAVSQNDYLGPDAIGQVLWDSLRNLDQTSGVGARLLQELSVKVFKISPSRTAGDQRDTALGVLAKLNIMASVAQGIIIGQDDDVQRMNASVSGFGEISDAAQRFLALHAEVPLVLLFGEAPAGLNTDGESWWRMWSNNVADHQEQHYREPLERLCRVFYAATGGEPETWSVEFNPIGELTEKERAEIRLINAQADQLDVMNGILPAERIARSRYGGGRYGFAIAPLTPEEEAALEAEQAGRSDPALLALAEEALRGARGEVSPTRVDSLGKAFREKRFKVPAGASGNARKVIAWRDEHGDDVRGMTATGWRRARQLASDDTVSGQDLIEIAAWGARHAAHADLSAEHKDEPWRDAGYVSWLGWGGDTMVTLAQQTVDRNRGDRADAEGSLCLWVALPAEARVEHDAWTTRAAVAVGEALREPMTPHVTVLYLGAVPEPERAEVIRIAREVVAARAPIRIRPAGVDLLGSAEEPAVVRRVHSWELTELHDELLTRLAHLVRAPQHPRYMAHATLGYAPPLTDEQAAAALALQPAEPFGDDEPAWTAPAVQVVTGDQVLATLPLLGRADAE